MNKFKTLLAVIITAIGLTANAAVKPIVVTSPNDYQVISLSPNGKWATGIFVDYASSTFGFLWNLESGVTTLLSTTETSYGSSVSNDGVVAGHFTYHPEDGSASFEIPGYYKDGEWHPVELPKAMTVGGLGSAGQGGGITPDGRLMSGALYIQGVYTPFVWNIEKGGTIERQLDITNPEGGSRSGNSYCMSPDGSKAGGWSYWDNRTATIWDVNSGEKTYIGYTDHAHQTPWASVNKFSADGKKILYGGGWNYDIDPEEAHQYQYCIYDFETGKITSLPTSRNGETVALFGISNDYSVVGSTSDYDSGLAIIYEKTANAEWSDKYNCYLGSTPKTMTQYLTEQGVDLSKIDIARNPENPELLTIFRGQDISSDGNVLAILYYGNDGVSEEGTPYIVLRSMIVMLNQDDEHAAPVDFSVKQLSGIAGAQLSWKKPLRAADGIKNFAIWRDGEKVATVGNDVTEYYENNLTEGLHTYYVTSVYEDEETASSSLNVTIRPQEVQAPQALFLRQKGMNNIHAQWVAPLTNLINKSWYNPSTSNVQGFGIGKDNSSIEMGISFSKEEMAMYAGTKITKVNFYPMSKQAGAKLNIYKYNAKGLPEVIYTQDLPEELKLSERNTITLNTPVDVPTDGDIVIAFNYNIKYGTNNIIGVDYGHYNPRYSDLIRFTDEPDFYSYYEMRQAQGTPEYMTYMIDMILEPEGASATIDEIDHYEISLGNVVKGTTKDCSYTIENVTSATADKTFEVQVKAVYADGRTSGDTNGKVNIKGVFLPVTEVNVVPVSKSAVNITWEAPIDNDVKDITYSGNTAGTDSEYGVKGPAENNYGIMAAAKYTPSVMKGYNGYEITGLKFFPTADALFTFMIISDGRQIAEVEVDDYKLNTWNTVQLDKPIKVSEASTYYLVLDIYDAVPDLACLALDTKTPFVGTSDLYSVDASIEEATWQSVSEQAGIRGNWMMGMVISDPNGKPVNVDGYDVYLNKPGNPTGTLTKRNGSTKVTDNEYTFDYNEEVNGKARVRIDTYHVGRTSKTTGNVVEFTFVPTTGINEVAITGNVKSYVIYSVNGVKAFAGNGNVINTSSLATGTYMVNIKTTTGETVVRKLDVK